LLYQRKYGPLNESSGHDYRLPMSLEGKKKYLARNKRERIMAKMSVSGDSRDASDNTPMTIGEIATAVAKKKTKGATKKRAIKTAAKKAGKKAKKHLSPA
jgi:hypothetical protein